MTIFPPEVKRIRLSTSADSGSQIKSFHLMETPLNAGKLFRRTNESASATPRSETPQSETPRSETPTNLNLSPTSESSATSPELNTSPTSESTSEYDGSSLSLNLSPTSESSATPIKLSLKCSIPLEKIFPPHLDYPPYLDFPPYYLDPPKTKGVMLNGYGGLVDTHKAHSPDDSSPNTEGISHVATLCNLGNTCFLNSVLYTLRFAPSFLHNLHHLATDLTEISSRYAHLKNKSSSLGRGIGGGSKNWSNKDLSTMGQGTIEDKIAVTSLRLHELYEALHNSELKDHIEPYQPEVFLTALRDVNPMFEGNQQHDAHELLVGLLDMMRETCKLLTQLHEKQRSIIPQPPPQTIPLPPISKNSFSSNVRKSLKLGKSRNSVAIDKKNPVNDTIGDNPSAQNEEEGPRVGQNFIAEDFEGVMRLYTTCLECEKTTSLSESFLEICVPVTTPPGPCVSDEQISGLYHSAIITEDILQDNNKYHCEYCARLCEARRNISYDTLPRLLVLQLKRFSSSYNSCVQKVNDYMPTTFNLSCFCTKCKDLEDGLKPHRGYELYGIIMHLGSTMASGHYVSYVSGRDTVIDSADCQRDKRKTASLSGGAVKPTSNTEKQKNLFRFFSKSSKPAYPSPLENRGPYFSPCRSSDCCGVKLDLNEPTWLVCDDDTVKPISKKNLEDFLGPKTSKNQAATPYLLFYSRII